MRSNLTLAATGDAGMRGHLMACMVEEPLTGQVSLDLDPFSFEVGTQICPLPSDCAYTMASIWLVTSTLEAVLLPNPAVFDAKDAKSPSPGCMQSRIRYLKALGVLYVHIATAWAPNQFPVFLLGQ